MNGYCKICEKEIEVKMCCNGSDCGCLGLPIDPPICTSDKCWEKYIEILKENTPPEQDEDTIKPEKPIENPNSDLEQALKRNNMKKLINSPLVNFSMGFIIALSIASTSVIVNGSYGFFDGSTPIAIAGFVFALALSNGMAVIDAEKIKNHRIITHWKNWIIRAFMAIVFSFIVYRNTGIDMLLLAAFIGSIFWIAFDIMLNKRRGRNAFYITVSKKASFFDKVFDGQIEFQLLAKLAALGITLKLLL